MISFIVRSAFFIPAFDSADETRKFLIENLEMISNGMRDNPAIYATKEFSEQVHGKNILSFLKLKNWKILTIGRSWSKKNPIATRTSS